MNASLSIGFVARQTGCTVPTIRYYEEIGLLAVAARTGTGHRHYSDDAVRRLTFIRRCRDFGFSIDQVRDLVGLVGEPQRPCAEVRDIAAAHLVEVRKKMEDLQALEESLATLVENCNAVCSNGPTTDCTILEDLAQPGNHARPRSGSTCCSAPAKPSEGVMS